MPGRQSTRRAFLARAGCLLAVTLAVAFVADCLWEPHSLRVYRVEVAIPDLPPAFEGFRIAQLTDIHHGPRIDLPHIQKAVDMANALSPDVTVLTGDYVYHGTRYIRPCFGILAGLRAKHGVFAVLGNHDHWEDADLTRACLREAGIPCLDNAGRWLVRDGQGIYLAGVGDLWTDEQRLDQALTGVPPDAVVVLLSHNPDYNEEMNDRRVKLMLSGHTHGGQVRLPLIGPPIVPSKHGRKYVAGLVQDGWKQVYVSRGVGVIDPAIRSRCRPEVTLLTLRRATQ